MAVPTVVVPAFADEKEPAAASDAVAAPSDDAQAGQNEAGEEEDATGGSDSDTADSSQGARPDDGPSEPPSAEGPSGQASDTAASEQAVESQADSESEAARKADPDAPATTSYPAALQTLEKIDEQIVALGDYKTVAADLAAGTLARDKEILFLQRSLIKDAGYDKLYAFAGENQHNSDFLQWLLTDYETLQLYVTGGRPGGCWWRVEEAHASHERSIGQFKDLAKAHAEDLTTGTEHDRLVYKKMMISAALGMSDDTRLWVGTAHPAADPVQRYEIIKKFRANADQYRFQKDLFDQLTVENMRWVFENRIANVEMPWLANYSLSRFPDASKEGSRLDPYSYIEYRKDYKYDDPVFFDVNSLYTQAISKEPNDAGTVIQGGWAAKYHFTYEDANFPNKEKNDEFYLSNSEDPKSELQRLWIPFESGGVCGAISKTCENLRGIVGVPATVAGQPGHAMCLTYSLVDDTTGTQPSGKAPLYQILNDSGAGWLRGATPEANHMPCGWLQSHEEVKNPDGSVQQLTTRYGGATYVLMAQDALNDMTSYTRAWELRQLADVQKSIDDKLAVYDKALEVQPFNWDTITAKVALYKEKGASQDEWVALAKATADACVEYPYPMHSFMVNIEQQANNPLVTVEVENIRLATLEKSLEVTAAESVQHESIKDTAKRLLGNLVTRLCDFSFDGDRAGEIVLGPQMDQSIVEWEYSVDGGKTWVPVSGDQHSVKLPDETIAAINATDDIQVRFKGAPSTTTIDITEGKAPADYFVNNAANRIYTREGKPLDSIEAKIGDEWVKLSKAPAFADDASVELRSSATGTTLASVDTKTERFTSEYDLPDSTFIPYDECSVNSCSSYNGGQKPERVLDGYFGPSAEWHNTYSREMNPQITIDLGEERSLSYIDFWRRYEMHNGIPFEIEVAVAPDTGLPKGEKVPDDAFKPVKKFRLDWNKTEGTPQHMRHLQLDAPTDARYVRLNAVATRTDSVEVGPDKPRFFTCTLLDFYEAKGADAQIGIADAPTFSDATFGYEAVDPVPLMLKNTGGDAAVIDAVESSSDAFMVVEGSRDIAQNASDDTWKIAPVEGLGAGTHTADITVRYHSASAPDVVLTAQTTASFVVAPASRTIEVRPSSIGDTSLRLEALPSAGAGAIEYALCSTDAAPSADAVSESTSGTLDGGWSASRDFEGLDPETTYYAFARIAGDPDYEDAVSVATPIKTAAEGEGGVPGAGTGGQGQEGPGGGSSAPGTSGQTGGVSSASPGSVAESSGTPGAASSGMAQTADPSSGIIAATGVAGLVAALAGALGIRRLKKTR